jgi:hypothetical protein
VSPEPQAVRRKRIAVSGSCLSRPRSLSNRLENVQCTQFRMFVDPDLLQHDEVWAAAESWNDNFGANPNDIVRVACGVVTDLKRN